MAKHVLDPEQELDVLEHRHRDLKQRVAYLDRRAFLTPAEQEESAVLKKEKLATKDAMQRLRSSISLN